LEKLTSFCRLKLKNVRIAFAELQDVTFRMESCRWMHRSQTGQFSIYQKSTTERRKGELLGWLVIGRAVKALIFLTH